ncbi:MAG: TraR/DksA family transcriptional regulator [Bacteroidetes bacterium]|nr:TraR/DksA family transcriptional regulator [Bacteroidota bacterium]
MAIKKKPTPKKAAKPSAKAKPVVKKPAAKSKPVAKKPAAKKVSKPAAKAKPVIKKPVPKAKPVAKKIVPGKAAKPAAKPVAKPKVVAKPVVKAPVKPAAKAPAKPTAKPASVKPAVVAKPAAVVTKPAPAPAKPVAPAPKPVSKKNDPASLVSIKPKAPVVTKKEPPRPAKVVIPKLTTRSAVKYEPDFTRSVLDSKPSLPAGPSMRYSDSDLAEFREIISRKLDAAKKELAYLQGLITRKDESGDFEDARYMTMEDGSVSMEREQLGQMASRQITFIDHLEKALMRIENKTYGVCRVTGKLIDKARLRAVPHATLSVEAKQMRK